MKKLLSKIKENFPGQTIIIPEDENERTRILGLAPLARQEFIKNKRYTFKQILRSNVKAYRSDSTRMKSHIGNILSFSYFNMRC